ncbi:uncharacterized protein LOC107359120 [Tetranychus urticae]|uniref:uncharacterized protein LOC107359120 n=1 Tax=Tetranychus urticae TaxID=32264 RepID=UPI00077B9DEF|nr:uncharacterized protein LOC107359120 [Tetranychus urticae]
MLLYIVFIISSSLLFDFGLTQTNFGNGAYPSRAPPRPSQPLPPHQPGDTFVLNEPYVPLNTKPRYNEVRTPTLNPYPQPDNVTNTLVAQIQGFGVLGYASFREIAQNELEATISITGGPANESYIARVFELPIQNGASCTPINVGKLITEFKDRQIEPNRKLVFPLDRVFTPSAIIGRTLMLQAKYSGVSICSVIMPGDDKKLIFIGKFHSPISGMAYYIQGDIGAAVGTEWMMFSDGKRRDDRFAWRLLRIDSDTVDSKVLNEKNRCQDLTGDVIHSSKQYLLPVSTEAPIWRGRMHLGLSTRIAPTDSIYLILETPNGARVACTSLNRVEPKVGVASFMSPDTRGEIKFTQDSPFEPTRVVINLDLFTPAFSYGIDVLPSLRRKKEEFKKCPNVKETIYNPFHVDPDKVPAQGMGTTEMYAVGDLSGKYGTLESRQSIRLTTWDVNLPLFGYYSVIGRAIVIYGPNGPAVACTNIELDGKPLHVVYATFDYPIQGQFIFRQPEGECFSDTYLYIEVSKHPSLDTDKTFNHPWHVHENKLNIKDTQLSTTDCGPAGGHHNPYNVSVASQNPIYVRDCNIFTPTRCEVGDLAHKLGHIDIPKYLGVNGQEPEVAKYYFIDSDSPLCGPAKIADKSLVIHEADFQMKRLSCANLFVYSPKTK